MGCLIKLVVWLSIVFKYGFTQECGFSHTIQSTHLESVNINLQDVPACFICPVIADNFTLNLETIPNAPPDVVIKNSTLTIQKWSVLSPLKLNSLNRIVCHENKNNTSYTTFFNITGSATQATTILYSLNTNLTDNTLEVATVSSAHARNQDPTVTINPTISTVVNSDVTMNTSDYVSIIIIAIIVPLSSILLIGIIAVVVLILIFRKRAKMEHSSMATPKPSSKPSNIPMTHGSPQQCSQIGDYNMVDLNQTEKIQHVKEVETQGSYNKFDRGQNNTTNVDSSGLYSVVDKGLMKKGADEDIPDLYSVAYSAKGKEAYNDCEVPDIYSEVDMSGGNVKSNNPTNVTDLYAVVDKSKKITKKHDKGSADDVSAMYAIVDKTKKKKEEDEEETDPNVLKLYAVVDKSKKTKKEEHDEPTLDLSEMYAAVNKSKKTKANHDDLSPDESNMYAVVT